MNKNKYSHISLNERETIESFLNTPDVPLKSIASSLDRSPKAIRNEIKKHRSLRIRSNQKNKCGKQNNCVISHLCGDCITGKCTHCSHHNCNEICPDFTKEPICPNIQRFPFVCNACPDKMKCKLPKFFYFARESHIEHIHAVSNWKMGPKKKESDLAFITRSLQEGVQNGLSIDIIIKKYKLPISVATAYRYIDQYTIPGIKNIDLKRKVRYSPKNTRQPRVVPKNYNYLKDRKFTDYLNKIEEYPELNIWEMDTVIGKQGKEEKCILTLLHRKSNLQLYFLLETHTSVQVNKIFDAIKRVLGPVLFKETFPIILTDNGVEFMEPHFIETDPSTGEQLCNVYYCDPRRSDQKGKCEKNHEHFREMIPKGRSMNSLTKKEINYVSNMVNNYPRKSLQYNSPYQVSKMFLDEKVFSLNRLSYHDHTKVKLNTIIK